MRRRTLRPGEVARTFRDQEAALRFLRSTSRTPSSLSTFRTLQTNGQAYGLGPVKRDEYVLKNLAHQLVSGHLLVIAEDRPYMISGGNGKSAGDPPAAPAAPPETPPPVVPEEPEVETHWIIFQVLDDDTGQPIEEVDLKLRLPGGRVQTFTTRPDGTVFVQGLDPGTVDVQQLIDDEVWEVVDLAA